MDLGEMDLSVCVSASKKKFAPKSAYMIWR